MAYLRYEWGSISAVGMVISVLKRVSKVIGCSLGIVFGAPGPAFAHGSGGVPGQTYSGALVRNELLACMVVAAIVLLRVSASETKGPRERRVSVVSQHVSGVLRVVGRTVGLLSAVAVVYLATQGTSTDPFGTVVRSVTLFYLGMAFLAAVFGNVWSLVVPWAVGSTKPLSLESERGHIQAAGLLAFNIVWLCYAHSHDPKSVGWIVGVYLVAMFAIRGVCGLDYAASVDPFAGLFGALAKCSPFQSDPSGATLGWPFRALMKRSRLFAYVPAAVGLGAVLFESLNSQTWWQTWGSSTSDSSVLLRRTTAFICLLAIIGVVVVVAAICAAYFGKRSWHETLAWLAPGVVPLLLGCLLGEDLYVFAQAVQDQLFVIWDPLGRGWHLFGSQQGVNVDVTGNYLGRVQNIVLVAAPLVAMWVVRRRAAEAELERPAHAIVPLFVGIGILGCLAVELMFPA